MVCCHTCKLEAELASRPVLPSALAPWGEKPLPLSATSASLRRILQIHSTCSNDHKILTVKYIFDTSTHCGLSGCPGIKMLYHWYWMGHYSIRNNENTISYNNYMGQSSYNDVSVVHCQLQSLSIRYHEVASLSFFNQSR